VQAVAMPPNLKNLDLFMKLQIEAQKNQVGIWGTPNPSLGTSFPVPAASSQSSGAPGAGSTKQVQIVWVCRSNNKYHRMGCSKLDRGAKPLPLEKAKEAGYSPCLMCNPLQ